MPGAGLMGWRWILPSGIPWERTMEGKNILPDPFPVCVPVLHDLGNGSATFLIGAAIK
jgi:hypothetical protein